MNSFFLNCLDIKEVGKEWLFPFKVLPHSYFSCDRPRAPSSGFVSPDDWWIIHSQVLQFLAISARCPKGALLPPVPPPPLLPAACENGTKVTKACWFCHCFPQYIWPWDHISQRSGMEGLQMPHLKKMAHLAWGSFPLLFLKMQRNLQNLECPMRRMYFQLLCSSLCYLYKVLESACGHVAQWLPCLTAGHRWPPGFTEFDSGAFSLFLQDESGTELPGETISWIIEWGI